jgi:hypothetical protein
MYMSKNWEVWEMEKETIDEQNHMKSYPRKYR